VIESPNASTPRRGLVSAPAEAVKKRERGRSRSARVAVVP
jgi:hypothetical protein